MRAREPALASPLWGDAVERLKPVIWSEGSDSTSLDNALELLCARAATRARRDDARPRGARGGPDMDPSLRGFYEFHECLLEPWDGPRRSRSRTA